MIGLCSFINHEPEEFYKQIYKTVYCKKKIKTFDDIEVFFYYNQFKHAFYESDRRTGNKTCLSHERANRIYWIKWALKNPDSELFYGVDVNRNNVKNRRVAVTFDDYVVIIELQPNNPKQALFITAYVANSINTKGEKAIDLIRKNPKWI